MPITCKLSDPEKTAVEHGSKFKGDNGRILVVAEADTGRDCAKPGDVAIVHGMFAVFPALGYSDGLIRYNFRPLRPGESVTFTFRNE